VRKKSWGDLILYLFLIIIVIFLWLEAIQTRAEEIKRPVFEPIPKTEQLNTEEDGELFSRTHEVDCIELSYEDAQLLMQIAAAEAEGEGPDGQRFVMSVVLNRVASPEWPNSIREVIFEPYQFYTAGMSSERVNADTHLALADIERGNVAPKIIGFEKCESTYLGQYFTPVFTYRHHTFYTLAK
jgi:hypothetical protein